MIRWAVLILLAVTAGEAYAHGTGSEILDPIPWGDIQATVQMNSEVTESGVTITLSMIRADDRSPLGDVSFYMSASHGQDTVFAERVESPDGTVIFDFMSQDSEVQVNPVSVGGLFGMFGQSGYEIRGHDLGEGGLYSLYIEVYSAAGHTPFSPAVFTPAVSVPITFTHSVSDPNWGEQDLTFITYYDTFTRYEYDPNIRTIYLDMPFSWQRDIIEQIDTVHIEFTVPDSFGDLTVALYDVTVNDMPLDPKTVTVEDFFVGSRTVHIVIPRVALLDMLDANGGGDTMVFVIKPPEDSPRSAVTQNGQYRVLAILEPAGLPADDAGSVLFNVTDVFLRNRVVTVPYSMEIAYQDNLLHTQQGITNNDGNTVALFDIPSGVSGMGTVTFSNLNGNELANASIEIIFDRMPQNVDSIEIPDWIRTTAGWWATGQIDDGEFVRAVAYMIQEEIIVVQTEPVGEARTAIDPWVRTATQWWAEGQVSDAEFLTGVQYMVNVGIIPLD